jgi:orotate phosphoribosyltransferase
MYVRKTGAVEGLRSVPPALRVVVVDDVLATGGSLLRAVAALRSAGAFVVGSVVLVDREIGGRQAVESDGVPLVSIFTLTELTQSG